MRVAIRRCARSASSLTRALFSRYLMNPSYLSTNMLIFSQCNMAIIHRTLQHHVECLAVAPCQIPGACCRAGRLLGRGTICRAPGVGRVCAGLAFCNGVTSECPFNSDRPDGSICPLAGPAPADGICSGGGCVSTSHDFCLAQGLAGCALLDQPCIPACSPAGAGSCTAHPAAAMPAGRPCRSGSGQAGVCTVAGGCHTSSLPALHQRELYPAPECRWAPGDWAPCSAECDGGVRNRSYECSCDDGSKDESGAWCAATRPNPVAEPCGERACTSCSTISVVAEGVNANSWSFHRRHGKVDIILLFWTLSHVPGWYHTCQGGTAIVCSSARLHSHTRALKTGCSLDIAWNSPHWTFASWVRSVLSHTITRSYNPTRTARRSMSPNHACMLYATWCRCLVPMLLVDADWCACNPTSWCACDPTSWCAARLQAERRRRARGLRRVRPLPLRGRPTLPVPDPAQRAVLVGDRRALQHPLRLAVLHAGHLQAPGARGPWAVVPSRRQHRGKSDVGIILDLQVHFPRGCRLHPLTRTPCDIHACP